jgi:uncharacterized protein (TIRG00374 family)
LKHKIFSGLKISFFLGIGFLFIWLFVRTLTPDQIDEVIQSFKRADYGIISLAILIGITSHGLRAWRWKILMEPLGYKPRYTNVFFAVFIGYLANTAVPRLGEVSRCGVLTRYEQIPFNKSFGTVISERALDMIVFILLFFFNLALQFQLLKDYIYDRIYMPLFGKFIAAGNLSLWFYSVFFFGVVLIGILYLFRKRFYHLKFVIKIRDMIKGFLEGMKALIQLRQPWLFSALTFSIWLCYFLMSYLVFFSLPETSSLSPNAGLAVLVFGSVGIMVVQGGIGVYQAIAAETLMLYGISSTTGYAMGWLLWSSQTALIIFMGLASMMLVPFYNRWKNAKA